MKALNLCSGIDISKNDFHACLISLEEDWKLKVVKSRKFSNTVQGISDYIYWISLESKKRDLEVSHIMEATGVYYEHLALSLSASSEKVTVVLPNKSKRYIESLGIKTKNDKSDAKALAMMGIQQKLDLWSPLSNYFYELRALTRMYQSHQENIISLKNQQEALKHGMYEQVELITQSDELIKMFKEYSKKLHDKIAHHIESNEEVSIKASNICKIKGISTLTFAIIIAETNGFELFTKSSQLVSFAGYDVVENQSGMHRGRTKISKKGNSRIRRALHLPSFTAVKYDNRFKDFYQRVVESSHVKMKGYVAVQKKLLVIIYSLWKNNQPYIENYLKPEIKISVLDNNI